jgi:hypothetical protein
MTHFLILLRCRGLGGSQVRGLETLVRWFDPRNRNLIFPPDREPPAA